jgi:hypothetical protein
MHIDMHAGTRPELEIMQHPQLSGEQPQDQSANRCEGQNAQALSQAAQLQSV